MILKIREMYDAEAIDVKYAKYFRDANIPHCYFGKTP